MAAFVFDTNVLVSALLFERSQPRQALNVALNAGGLLLSAPVLTELSTVLRRPKFDRYIDAEDRERFLIAVVREAILVDAAEPVRECRDRKDDKFLELAVAGAAACIVSGDDDLLQLDPFRQTRVLTPAQFLQSQWALG